MSASEDPGAGRRPWRSSSRPASGGPARRRPAPSAARTSRSGTGRGRAQPRRSGPATPSGRDRPGFDWVTPFETETGCIVNTTDMTDSNNGVSLIQSGELRRHLGLGRRDDAPDRRAAIVAPINTDLFPNYANVFAGLKDLPHNTVDGVNYGVPHGRGPNLLMYNTETSPTAPTSWDAIWEGGADYAGKISVYDSSIYIADAALHLMTTQPDLGITDPYQLNAGAVRRGHRAARGAGRQRPALLGHRTADQIASFAAGDVVVGTTWQFQVNLLQADERLPVAGVKPDEGTTGWSDTWMIATEAKHPNCMLMWMDHMMSAEANAQATVWFGEAATSPQACEAAETISPGHCELTHADDEAYWENIWYWTTPQEDCADDDAATTCKTQDDWVEAWTELRGS